MSDVAVIGAGYVGLTTAACLAHLGHRVTCADIDVERVAAPVEGRDPDPRGRAAGAGRRRPVVAAAHVRRRRGERRGDRRVRVPVRADTPGATTARPNLSFVEDVAREIAPVLRAGAVVINKSTMPVGSTRLVQRILAEAGAAIEQLGVASNPEFLREGIVGPRLPAAEPRRDRLRRPVGRGPGQRAVPVAQRADARHRPGVGRDDQVRVQRVPRDQDLVHERDREPLRDVDADVREVALGMGYDQRIGFEFLHPGPGYGGSCFPKDTAALLYAARRSGYDFSLLEGVVDVNLRQHERMVEKVRNLAGGIARRRADRGLGPHLQGEHRRPAGLAGARDRPPAARGGCGGPGLRPGGGRAGRRARPRARGRPRPVRRVRGCRACSRCSPSGTSSGGSTSTGCSTALDQPRGARRPQPARPGRAPPARLHLRGRRPLVDRRPAAARDRPSAAARRRHRRGRLPRLAPLRAADRRRLGRRRSRQHADRAHGEHRRACSSRPEFTFERHDVTNFIHVTGAVDAVLHFASPASPQDYLEHPIKTMKVGALGTHNTLGLALAKQARGTCWRRRARSTATRWCTPSPRATGATSTRSARAASTTRRSASPRR